MNFRNTPGRRRREDFGVDLMPLIDVVFLLLIFFLITTSFARPTESQIPINLPSGVTGSETGKGEKAVLFVTDDGTVEFDLDDTEVTGDDLKSKLTSLYEQKPDISILLKGDTEASHGRIVEVLDSVKASGFKKVNLVIKKPDEE